MIYIALYISIGINILLVLLIISLFGFAKIRKLIRQLVAEAEQVIPGQTGADKLAWVIEQLKGSSFFSRFLSTAFLKTLIESALKIMQHYSGQNK